MSPVTGAVGLELCRRGVHSMEQILRARTRALGLLDVSIDGGAGWGETTRTMARWTHELGTVYAFEPFPGNHRFFESGDARIQLAKKAISDRVGRARFLVPQVVSEHDAWANKGLLGYSSVGHLDRAPRFVRSLASLLRRRGRTGGTGQCIDVDVTRIDTAVDSAHIDFVKLDLQGAEFEALTGMGRLLPKTDLLWIEFTNQPGLLELLVGKLGFLAFDTDNYLCLDSNAGSLADLGLAESRRITLSTSRNAIVARRVVETTDYARWFRRVQRAGVIQTDLLFVRAGFLPDFLQILAHMEDRPDSPAGSQSAKN